jgi:hypothetical protein
MGCPELVASVASPPLPAQPFSKEEVGPRQLGFRRGSAKVID